MEPVPKLQFWNRLDGVNVILIPKMEPRKGLKRYPFARLQGGGQKIQA
jgi:hypothetical protein